MFQSGLAAFVIAYLPGAVLYRLPIADRDRRAALGADERLFWYVVLSIAWSLALVLGLAVANAYRLDRLVALNTIGSVVLIVAYRGDLRFGNARGSFRWTALLPIVLVALGVWRFFPPAEYIIGGRDPGTYMNEGVQISQRGSLVSRDATVAAVPEAARPLFFGAPGNGYEGERFIAFYVQDFTTGQTIGQFPQLFPASIALGYDLNGLTGARSIVGVWATLGVLAVYFAGARLVGRPAALAAGVLLSLHVIEVWFGRYPNSEVLMQTFGFAAVLAFARAHQDDDRFFGPIAGLLATLLIFARVDALMIVIALVAAAILGWLLDRRPLRAGFFVAIAVGTGLGLCYLAGPMRAYFWRPMIYLEYLPAAVKIGAVAAAALGMAILAWLRRLGVETRMRPIVPVIATIGLAAAAAYAYFWREPGGRLAEADAKTLRMFTDFYLLPMGLIATLAGFAIVARRHFWRDPALFVMFVVFCAFFFYKNQATAEQFWMARRFVPVILPGALLFIGAAAFGSTAASRPWRLARLGAGVIVTVFLAQHYVQAAAAVASHVEYAGLASKLERLASRFTDRDLVLVEASTDEADMFAMAVPLANIYGRNVLVLQSERPDRVLFEAFLRDTLTKYERLFFLASGGSDVLSRQITASPEGGDRVRVPEFEHTPWNVLPQQPRRKDFDYAVYRLGLGACHPSGGFTLDVGFEDDLNLLRFSAKEQTNDNGVRTYRWTRARSYIAVPCLGGGEREVTFVMHDGGRSPKAVPARVEVSFNDESIGTIVVGKGFQTYTLALPADLVRKAAAVNEPARLTLRSTLWIPRDFLGGTDDRELGVMLDRVQIK